MIQKYIDKAIEEIDLQIFGTTQQYLEVHSVVRENNIPKVARVETEQDKESVIVYFPIENNSFFLAVYFDKNEEIKVRGVGHESGNRVYFRVTSEELSFEELKNKIDLNPISGWDKNDIRIQNPSVKYNFSALHFDPIPDEAYEMEYKLNLLLEELEKDKMNVRYLAENHGAYISIASYRYVDSFGGINLDRETIKRLSDLCLEISFDIYVEGNHLKPISL